MITKIFRWTIIFTTFVEDCLRGPLRKTNPGILYKKQGECTWLQKTPAKPPSAAVVNSLPYALSGDPRAVIISLDRGEQKSDKGQ
jgi:hypothetical protein